MPKLEALQMLLLQLLKNIPRLFMIMNFLSIFKAFIWTLKIVVWYAIW